MTQKLVMIERRLPPQARLAPALIARAEVICLGYEERRRSRLRSRLATGEEAALFMPHGTVLKTGDILLAADGRLVRVVALDEAVIDVSHPEPLGLLKVAYHFGNRHIPLEIHADSLRLLSDNVLADLARQLGARVVKRSAPFEPELGAYGGGHRHGHDVTFAEDHALARQTFMRRWPNAEEVKVPALSRTAHRHGHDHGATPAHDHVHADGHEPGHDHGHDHGSAHAHGANAAADHAHHGHDAADDGKAGTC